MEESGHHRSTTRPSYERKMLTSLPLSNSSPKLPRQPDLDFSLLDYKSVDDFLYLTKSKTEFQDLSKHLAKQLKASRSLLSMSRYLTVGNSPRDIIHKIIDTASAIIDAERVLFLEFDSEAGELVCQKLGENPETMFRVRDGVECKCRIFSFTQLYS